MNGLPYYKAYPRDFIEGTIGMPFEVKCAYRVVLDLIYLQGGRLPDDPRYISGNLGCSIRKWKSIRQHLVEIGKLEVSGEFLTNKRADNELETLSKYRENQAENARKPRKNNAVKKPSQSQRALKPEPEPEPLREDTKVSSRRSGSPEGFDAFWSIWPSKKNKAQALKAWRKLTIEDKRAAYAAIQRGWFDQWQRASPDANPIHAATFLNARRWEDQLDAPRLRTINGGFDDNGNNNAQPADRPRNRPDPALEQIARLAGIGQAPGNGGG